MPVIPLSFKLNQIGDVNKQTGQRVRLTVVAETSIGVSVSSIGGVGGGDSGDSGIGTIGGIGISVGGSDELGISGGLSGGFSLTLAEITGTVDRWVCSGVGSGIGTSVGTIGGIRISGISIGEVLGISISLGLSVTLADVVGSISVRISSINVGSSGSLGGEVLGLSNLDGVGLGGGNSSVGVSGQTEGGVGSSNVGRSVEVLGISLGLSLALADKVGTISTIGIGISSIGIRSIGSLSGKVLGLGSLDGEGVGGDNSSVGVGGESGGGVGAGVSVSKQVLGISLRLGNCESSEEENCNLRKNLR